MCEIISHTLLMNGMAFFLNITPLRPIVSNKIKNYYSQQYSVIDVN